MEYKKGNFVWENGVINSKVVFVEHENGRFLIGWNPPKKDK